MQHSKTGGNSTKLVAEAMLCIWILTFSLGITKVIFFPIKAIILLLFLFFSLFLFINSGRSTFFKHKWTAFFLWSWITISIFIGISNGFGLSTVSQSASLISSFLAVIFAFLLYGHSKINIEAIKKTIYLTAATGVTAKIIIGLSAIFGILSADGIDQMMQEYLGSASFNVDVFGGFLGLLPRIGNAGDLFYLIVFLFYAKEHDGIKVAATWLLVLLFVIISYSRYLMVVFSITSIYIASLSIKSKPKTAATLISAITLLLITDSINLDTAILEITNRFTGQIQYESDSIRSEMKDILSTVFYENLFFGIGMGGYVNNYLRSPTNLWQYELEYLSMLMQFGILGFIFIVLNYSIYVIRMIFSNYNKFFMLPMIVSAAFWIGTPMQSSLFSGTQSALIIVSIFFLSRKSILQSTEDMPNDSRQSIELAST